MQTLPPNTFENVAPIFPSFEQVARMMIPHPDFSPTTGTDASPPGVSDGQYQNPTMSHAGPPGVSDSQYQNTAIEKKPKQSDAIGVGTFWLNGEKKHYAIINGPHIHCPDTLADIREYWGLPNPGFLLETNESNTHRDSIISAENAPIILNEIFKNDSNYNSRRRRRRHHRDN